MLQRDIGKYNIDSQKKMRDRVEQSKYLKDKYLHFFATSKNIKPQEYQEKPKR